VLVQGAGVGRPGKGFTKPIASFQQKRVDLTSYDVNEICSDDGPTGRSSEMGYRAYAVLPTRTGHQTKKPPEMAPNEPMPRINASRKFRSLY